MEPRNLVLMHLLLELNLILTLSIFPLLTDCFCIATIEDNFVTEFRTESDNSSSLLTVSNVSKGVTGLVFCEDVHLARTEYTRCHQTQQS